MAVRLSDVAKFAGVSERTVSNVASGYKHVSPAMRARVQSAIDELGYSPHLTARRLAQGRTGTIGLSVPWINKAYFSELAAVIIDTAHARGYAVLVEQTDGSAARELAAISQREQGSIDGLIFQPSALSSTQVAKARKSSPLVLLGEYARPVGTAHVMIDNVEAARMATKHLLDGGRTRIAYLGASEDQVGALSAISGGRLIGWRQAIEDAGGTIDQALIVRTNDWTARGGTTAMLCLLDSGTAVDAVLCTEDSLAIGALLAIASRGIRVPDDIAVVGWDNITASEFLYPSLTTIAPDRAAIAEKALDLLIRQIEGDADANQHVLAPFSLVERQSTASASTR